MKLCKDCRWSRNGWFASLMGVTVAMKCSHPVAGLDPVRTDPVSGKIEGGGNAYCSTARMLSDECGRDGALWEAK